MRLIAFIILTFAFSPMALAQDGSAQEKEIHALDKKLKDTKESKANLENELKDIQKTLKSSKGDLVKTAKAVQDNEKTLQRLDIRIKDLRGEKQALSTKLEKDRASIANLILALDRINRIPTEALIVTPESPYKTAQSAMLLEEILPTLNSQAKELKDNLKRLQDISAELDEKREQVVAAAKELKSEQARLNALVDKRTKLYASTRSDLAAEKKRIQSISAQSSNLRDLVKNLEEERTRAQSSEKRIATPVPKPGKPRLPLPGIITTSYDEPDNFGAPSKGIDIEGRAGALVVAPMGGVVQFAGFFKNYGNMVILEHESGWHSLIAGLENIDTVVGQSISVGEPLGVLHKSASGQKPVLYYELRYKGKPVNPAKKFGDLS